VSRAACKGKVLFLSLAKRIPFF